MSDVINPEPIRPDTSGIKPITPPPPPPTQAEPSPEPEPDYSRAFERVTQQTGIDNAVSPESLDFGTPDPRFSNELTNKPIYQLPDTNRGLSPGVVFPTLYRNPNAQSEDEYYSNFGNNIINRASNALGSTLNDVNRMEAERAERMRAQTDLTRKAIADMKVQENTGLAAFFFGRQQDYSKNRKVDILRGEFGEQGGGVLGALGYLLGGISSSINAANAANFEAITPDNPSQSFSAGSNFTQSLLRMGLNWNNPFDIFNKEARERNALEAANNFAQFKTAINELSQLDKGRPKSFVPRSVGAVVAALLPTNWASGANPFVNKPALNNVQVAKGYISNLTSVWTQGRKFEDTNNPFTRDGLFFDARRLSNGKDSYSFEQKVASSLWNALVNPGDELTDGLLLDPLLKGVVAPAIRKGWSALPLRKKIATEVAANVRGIAKADIAIGKADEVLEEFNQRLGTMPNQAVYEERLRNAPRLAEVRAEQEIAIAYENPYRYRAKLMKEQRARNLAAQAAKPNPALVAKSDELTEASVEAGADPNLVDAAGIVETVTNEKPRNPVGRPRKIKDTTRADNTEAAKLTRGRGRPKTEVEAPELTREQLTELWQDVNPTVVKSFEPIGSVIPSQEEFVQQAIKLMKAPDISDLVNGRYAELEPATLKRVVNDMLVLAGNDPIPSNAGRTLKSIEDYVKKTTGHSNLVNLAKATPYRNLVEQRIIQIRGGQEVSYTIPPKFDQEIVDLVTNNPFSDKAALLAGNTTQVAKLVQKGVDTTVPGTTRYVENLYANVSRIQQITGESLDTVTKHLKGEYLPSKVARRLDKAISKLTQESVNTVNNGTVVDTLSDLSQETTIRATLDDVEVPKVRETETAIITQHKRVVASPGAADGATSDGGLLKNSTETNATVNNIVRNDPDGDFNAQSVPTPEAPTVAPVKRPRGRPKGSTGVSSKAKKKAPKAAEALENSTPNEAIQGSLSNDVAKGKVTEANVTQIVNAIKLKLEHPEVLVVSQPFRGRPATRKVPAKVLARGWTIDMDDIIVNVSGSELSTLDKQADAIRQALNIPPLFDVLITPEGANILVKGNPDLRVLVTKDGFTVVTNGVNKTYKEANPQKLNDILDELMGTAEDFKFIENNDFDALPNNTADLLDNLEVSLPTPIKITEPAEVGNVLIPGTSSKMIETLHGSVLRSDSSLITNVLELGKTLGYIADSSKTVGIPTKLGLLTLSEISSLSKHAIAQVLDDLQGVKLEVINALNNLNNLKLPSVAVPNLADGLIAKKLNKWQRTLAGKAPLSLTPLKKAEEKFLAKGGFIGFHGTAIQGWVPVRNIRTEAINRFGFGTYITPNFEYAKAASNRVLDNSIDMNLPMGNPKVYQINTDFDLALLVAQDTKVSQKGLREFLEAVLPPEVSLGSLFNTAPALSLSKVYDKIIDASIVKGTLDEQRARYLLAGVDEYIKRLGYNGILDKDTLNVKVLDVDMIYGVPYQENLFNSLSKQDVTDLIYNKSIVEQPSMFANKLEMARAVDNRFELLKQINATLDDQIRNASEVRVAQNTSFNLADEVYYGEAGAKKTMKANIYDDQDYMDDMENLGNKIDIDNPCDY